MSEDTAPEYVAIAGFVQFEPRERTANGQDVREIVVTSVTPKQSRFYVTIWPAYAEVAIEKGDFVAVQGKLNRRAGEKDGAPVTYLNLSANQFVNMGQAVAVQTERVNIPSAADVDDSGF